MAKMINMSNFPKLVIDSDNIHGSFMSWKYDFDVAIELASLKLGVDDNDQQVFRGRLKLLTLIQAVGSVGKDVFTAVGFNIADEASTYDQAMGHLEAQFGIQDNIYVRTMRFVTVNQALGEKETDYLLRVNKLSRTMNIPANSDEVRVGFALALAVNGLRNSDLRRELMERNDLTWDNLNAMLRARQSSKESELILSENTKTEQVLVKKEVASIESDTKASRTVNRVYREGRSRSKSPVRSSSPYRRSEGSGRPRSDGGGVGNTYPYDSPGRSNRNRWQFEARNDHREDYYKPSSPGKQYSEYRQGAYKRGSPYSGRRYSPEYSSGYPRSPPRRSPSPGRVSRCFTCGDTDHMARYCPQSRCYNCNAKGHISMDCRDRESSSLRNNYYGGGRDRNRDGRPNSPTSRVRFNESDQSS